MDGMTGIPATSGGEAHHATYEPAETTGLEARPAFTPAHISAGAYLAMRRESVERLMEPFRDMRDESLAAMSARDIRACRTSVNRIIREVEDERRAIKRAYDEPLKQFEAQVKELLGPARAAAEQLSAALNEKTEAERRLREQRLRQTYEEFAPALAPVVPFERILQLNPKWTNATYGAQRAEDELAQAVSRIAQDWESLRWQADSMPFYQETEAEFFRTLSLEAAEAHHAMRAAEQARIDAMKADMAANQDAQGNGFDEPAASATSPVEPGGPHATPLAKPGTAAPSDGADEVRHTYCIHIDLTERERAMLVEWIQRNDIGANRRISSTRPAPVFA